MSSKSPESSADPGSRPESLLDTLRGIWRDLPGLFSDRVELLSVELQRAGQALLQIAVWGLALAVLGITAWLILWSLIITALTLAGVHWMVAFVGALGVHTLLGVWVVQRVKHLLPMLRLPATRRHLMFTSSPVPIFTPATPAPADDAPPG